MHEIKYARQAARSSPFDCAPASLTLPRSRPSTFHDFKQTFSAAKNSRIFQIQFFLDKYLSDKTLNLKN